MKIFISWSGNKSRDLAETLRAWLPSVVQAVKPYFSPADVSKGSRWSSEIAQELEQARMGIVCLTRDNLEAPWLLFEAGALSKSIATSRVCPLLFDLDTKDVKGPLLQFQCARFQKNEMFQIVSSINGELGEAALESDVLGSVFEMWWPRLENGVKRILESQPAPEGVAVRTDRDVLEELLQLARHNASSTQKALVPEQLLISALDGFLELLESIKAIAVDERVCFAVKRLYRRFGRLADSVDLQASARDRARKRMRSIRSEIERMTGVGEPGDFDDYEAVQ